MIGISLDEEYKDQIWDHGKRYGPFRMVMDHSDDSIAEQCDSIAVYTHSPDNTILSNTLSKILSLNIKTEVYKIVWLFSLPVG